MLKYVLLFLIYSFIGWLIEVINTLTTTKKLVNRGFLIGPYCPIYGFGALSMIILLRKFTSEPIILFVMSIVIFSLLEYYTSYFMEKIFKARWWDYSNKRFNINGRICLETMIPFGILGCLTMYIINPFFEHILLMIDIKIINMIAIMILIILILDFSISFKIILNFRNISVKFAKDSTEEITKLVKKALYEKSIFSRRLIDSFPHLNSVINKLKSRE